MKKINRCCKLNWVLSHGGEVYCEKCGNDYFFTDLKIPTITMRFYYEDWNNPDGENYTHDKEMVQFFEEMQRKYNIQHCINDHRQIKPRRYCKCGWKKITKQSREKHGN